MNVKREGQAGTITLLIVDDDELFAGDLKLVLKDRFRIIHRVSLMDIESVIEREQPSIILSDLHLGPNENGFELFKRLEKSAHRPPVLMMSDRPSIKVVVQAMSLGAEGFITKSTDSKELLQALDNALRRHK